MNWKEKYLGIKTLLANNRDNRPVLPYLSTGMYDDNLADGKGFIYIGHSKASIVSLRTENKLVYVRVSTSVSIKDKLFSELNKSNQERVLRTIKKHLEQ